MSQNVVLSLKGLFTYPNNLSAVPNGALVEAENIYIDRNDVAQPRRGFKIFTDATMVTTAKSLHDYQNRILVHQSDILQFEDDPVTTPGVFTTYEESVDGVFVDATIESPDEAAGLKIKSIESNRNFYYTTQKGIMKIDNVTNSTLRSGVPQALDFDLTLVDQEGFLLQNTACAYRIVWGYKDANNNLILSAPSQREVVYYYGLPQFILDINGMLAEIALQSPPFTETYPADLTSTATLSTIYGTMKDIVKSLNQESVLTSKEYQAGGTINISSITTRPKSALAASDYFIFEANNGRYVPYMNLSGVDPAPDLNLQPDLLLTDTVVSVNLATAAQATLVNQGITYTAVPLGVFGNDVTVTIIDPVADGPLTITASGNDLTITLAQAAGVVTTTATQLVTALGLSAPALALVTAAGAGAAPLVALAQTNLAAGTGTISDVNDATQVAAALQLAIDGSTAEQTNELNDNQLILRTLYDQVVMATVDGDDTTGFTFSTIRTGTVLSTAQLTLETLQEAYDIIVASLNANGGGVSPDFEDATISKAVSLYITIPSDIINLSESGTTFFYQVYRSALFDIVEGVVIVPDDELQLVYENNPTTPEITAGFVGPFTDETTDAFRAQGALLYTNPSQEGILQSNFQPPFAKDITLYKQQVFFANTREKYKLTLSLLTGKESSGPTDPGFNTSSQALLVNQGVTYKAVAYGTGGNSITIRLLDPGLSNSPLSASILGNAITFSLATDGAGVITTTATQLVAFIALSAPVSVLITATGSGASPLTALAATPLATGTTGTVLTFTSDVDSFTIVFVPDTASDDFENGVVALIDETSGSVDPSDDLSVGQVIEQMAQKIVKAVNRHLDNPFMNAYYSSGFDELPGSINFESRYLENLIFTISGNTVPIREAFSPTLGSPDAVATNNTAVNRVYYSKFQQPEAVPSLNYFDIGAGDKGIIRILASRDSLFIFKEDGLFTISGQEGESLQVNTLDNTCKIKGPETAVIGNNQIYVFADDGVLRVSEAGPEVISRPIEDKLLALPDTALYTNLSRAAFGVFYDTEKKYYLWLPTVPGDTVATQCFVWNTYTDTWTRLPISKTCGLVNSRDNKLYLGASDTFDIEQERKTFTMFDYADRQYSNQIQSVSYDDYTEELTVKLQSVAAVKVGDVIEQTEYLNPYYFNRILTQLDANPSPTIAKNYYSLLAVTEKSELLTNLNALADKLDADPGVTDTDYRANIDAIVGSTPVIVLQKFNELVEQMNTDTGIDDSTFPTVDETFTFYSHIMSISESAGTVVMQDNFPFEIGACTTYEGIESSITWSPNHAGNPAVWKHFREANMLFSEVVLRQLEIGFASDVSRNYQTETFTDNSLAGWGIVEWGLEPWGSNPEPRAYRTYIPRLKQRSRYLNTQFSHGRAFEYYLLNGVSISYDVLTERVTR